MADAKIEVDEEVEDVKCPECDETECDLECEVCLRWFHSTCVDVSALKLQQIKKHGFHWYCQSCDVAAVQIISKVNTLLTDNLSLKKEVKSLTKKLNSLQDGNNTLLQECEQKVANKFEQEVNNIKEEVKTGILNEIGEARGEDGEVTVIDEENPNPWGFVAARRRNGPQPDLRKIISEEVKERKALDLIKNNLVMAGVHEKESAAEDLQAAKDIILQELDIEAEIEEVIRCGKKPERNGKPRTLKLIMKTQVNRKSILQNAKKLRLSDDDHIKNNVYINPDMTTAQQLAAKNLRDQRNKMREENPGKTYKIQRGVVVEVPAEVPGEEQALE